MFLHIALSGEQSSIVRLRSTRSKGTFILGPKAAKMKPIKLVALHQSIELDLPPHFSNQWRNVEWTGAKKRLYPRRKQAKLPMHVNQPHYLPLPLPFFSILVGVFVFLAVLLQVRALRYAYMSIASSAINQ